MRRLLSRNERERGRLSQPPTLKGIEPFVAHAVVKTEFPFLAASEAIWTQNPYTEDSSLFSTPHWPNSAARAGI
jgi:hypothetical protein